jgi:hypothetical protein
MRDLLTQAQPPLEFIPPDYTPWVQRLTRLGLPTWTRLRTDIADIDAEQADILADLYRQFQQGQVRFMIAFRHPNPEDSFALARLLWRLVPQAAQQKQIPLQSPTHAHFIYDRGIPLWAGGFVSWLYSKLGGTPIQRGKVDRMGLRSARELFVDGQFPIAASPEGGNNGHNEVVSPLEPGIAQLGFWCAEDLDKRDRNEAVLIVPLGIQYRYVTPPWDAIADLLSQLEADSGLEDGELPAPPLPLDRLPATAGITPEALQVLYQRLFRLGEHLLRLMEQFYAEYYNCPVLTFEDAHSQSAASDHKSNPAPDVAAAANSAQTDLNQRLAQRLNHLLNAALQVAEDYFNLQPKGSVIDRCRRLEQAGWNRIYREDFRPAEAPSAVERGLADRIAEEASLRMWHMRIVETFVAVTGRYVKEKPSADRFAETLMLLRDMIMRIKGENPFPRPSLGARKVQIRVGQPLSVSERKDDYRQNRRRAIAQLTQDLQIALESLIIKS